MVMATSFELATQYAQQMKGATSAMLGGFQLPKNSDQVAAVLVKDAALSATGSTGYILGDTLFIDKFRNAAKATFPSYAIVEKLHAFRNELGHGWEHNSEADMYRKVWPASFSADAFQALLGPNEVSLVYSVPAKFIGQETDANVLINGMQLKHDIQAHLTREQASLNGLKNGETIFAKDTAPTYLKTLTKSALIQAYNPKVVGVELTAEQFHHAREIIGFSNPIDKQKG